MESFSYNTKKELLSQEKVKKCCAFSFVYGCLFLSNEENDAYVLKKANVENARFFEKCLQIALKGKIDSFEYKSKELRINKGIARYFTIVEYANNVFKCDACVGEFLKALFLICGTVNDPEKSYRLELVFESEIKRDSVLDYMSTIGFAPKKCSRFGRFVLYLRDSEQIENFLTLIGAVNSTFAVMNSKIYKEFVNNANRASNCDNANISKSLKANEKYISAILDLISREKIDSLPEQLKETALKRIEHRELNFEQLGKKFDPPISKSGIYHRLEKILSIYESLKNN